MANSKEERASAAAARWAARSLSGADIYAAGYLDALSEEEVRAEVDRQLIADAVRGVDQQRERAEALEKERDEARGECERLRKPKCDDCNDTGWYGQNGPGPRGHGDQWGPCECAMGAVQRPVSRMLDELGKRAESAEAELVRQRVYPEDFEALDRVAREIESSQLARQKIETRMAEAEVDRLRAERDMLADIVEQVRKLAHGNNESANDLRADLRAALGEVRDGPIQELKDINSIHVVCPACHGTKNDPRSEDPVPCEKCRETGYVEVKP